MIFTLTALICCTLDTEPDTIPRVKEFPEYSCQITLPDSKCQWMQEKLPPDTLAVFIDDTGMKLVVAAQKVPAGVVLNESLIKNIQMPYSQDDSVSIINGEMITFREIPCYQFQIRFKENSSISIIRIFIANGCLYDLQFVDNQLPVDALKNPVESLIKLETGFSAFKFIGTPDIPVSTAHAPEKKTYQTGILLMKVVFFIFIIVGVLLAVAKNSNRK